MRVNNSLPLLYSFFLCSSLAVISLCYAEETTPFEVVGSAECADCKENNLKPSLAYLGLGVTIDCKLKNGEINKRVGAGRLDAEGNFKVSVVPQEFPDADVCYAQLHSAAEIPCPAHDGLQAHKIGPKAQSKTTFGPAQNIKFSSALCTSKFLWAHHHFKHPTLPKVVAGHPLKKKFPPLKSFGHPWLHKPTYKPPTVPIYKPKPKLPSVPIYKPIVKPLPPPVPIYKPPVYKKKPCPPIPKILPPVPKIPPKHFEHPKLGHLPPLPPTIPHHP